MIETFAAVLRTAPGLSRGEFRVGHAAALLGAVPWAWPPERRLRTVLLTDDAEASNAGALPFGVEVIPLRTSLPGWWAKLELCGEEYDAWGDVLYADLDTVLIGKLDALLSAAERHGSFAVLEDFYRPGRVASGLMALSVDARRAVRRHAAKLGAWRSWIGRYRGDQEFFEEAWRDGPPAFWQRIAPGAACSFKVHVAGPGKLPEGAAACCFHGLPRPWQVGEWFWSLVEERRREAW